jgi:hypothetical protein
MTKAVIATFRDEGELQQALASATANDWHVVGVYGPYEFETPGDALKPESHRRRAVTLAGVVCGLTAIALVYLFEWWAMAAAYPFLIGGRPEHPWPALLLPALEAGALAAGIGAFLGFLHWAGMPSMSASIFESSAYDAVAGGAFALAVEANAGLLDQCDALRRLGATAIEETEL